MTKKSKKFTGEWVDEDRLALIGYQEQLEYYKQLVELYRQSNTSVLQGNRPKWTVLQAQILNLEKKVSQSESK